MAGSISVKVRQKITEGLTTHFGSLTDFNGTDPEHKVEVAYGYKAEWNATEKVFFGRSRAGTPPAALKAGRNHRNETAVMDLVVLVEYVGGDAEECDERTLAIGAEVETWIADRKSNELGVPGLTSLTVQSWELVSLFNELGCMTELTYKVAYNARLT
jgi:hypothetical protein